MSDAFGGGDFPDQTAELLARAAGIGTLVTNCVTFGFGGLRVDGFVMETGSTLVRIWALCADGFVVAETTVQGAMLNVTVPLFRIRRCALTWANATITMVVELDADSSVSRPGDDNVTVHSPARYVMSAPLNSPMADELVAFNSLLRARLCTS